MSAREGGALPLEGGEEVCRGVTALRSRGSERISVSFRSRRAAPFCVLRCPWAGPLVGPSPSSPHCVTACSLAAPAAGAAGVSRQPPASAQVAA